ncbi:MAG: HAD family hydrolase [Nanoarchaeota archaeon]|nr:HAD family hydrolase [Nanoarchaeota archaeon]
MNSLYKNNVLVVSDVDGTLVNTNGAVKDAQLRTFERLGFAYEQAASYLNELGLKGAVQTYLKMDLNEFFSKHYKTFDSVQAAQEGTISVFSDAKRLIEGYDVYAISNSTQQATERKLNALGLADAFLGISAAFLQEEAKPQLYLAQKAFQKLDDLGLYDPKAPLIHVGDQEYDVQFGHNIKQIHPNTISLLIDRGKPYKGVSADGIITSLDQIGEYHG